MIDTATLFLFLAAAWAMILTPGPDMLYVLARGAASGRRAGLVSGLGVGCGECIHTALAVLGLAALLATSLTAFLVLKYIGAGYLFYLGIKTIRDKTALVMPGTVAATSLRTVFRQGMLTNLLNPKAVLFFVAFLPQFVNPARGHTHVQILLFGILFALSDILFLSVLAYSTGYIHTWFRRHPQAASRLRWGTGSILIGLGVRLAVTEHPSH